MRTLFSFFLLVGLAAGTQSFASEESVRPQIQQWIQQLGNDSFLVRQRAESLLIHAGAQAYPELQRAKQSRDLEIARRAEYVLSQIEQSFLDLENRDVAFWIQGYIESPNLASKARIIWFLADPVPTLTNERGFDQGEGLQTLSRLVRFEENDALHLEAAKSLIASPPISTMLRQKWFQTIRDNFRETGDVELHQALALYAKLWCDLDEADEKTTPELQERVRQVSAETLQLLKRPENMIQIGSKIDILLHYAVAELQDAAGLTEERDRTIAAALAIQPEPIQTTEPVFPVDLGDGLLMYEHYRVGWYLRSRFRLHWAMAHFQKVIETGHILLRVYASEHAAKVALYLADYSAAAALYDKHLELLNSPEYRAEHNPEQQIAQAQKQRVYCLAEQAAAEENWEGVRELISRAWSVPNVAVEVEDIDLVILAHRLCEEHPDVAREFKDKVEPVLRQFWKNIADTYEKGTAEMRLEQMSYFCNTAAWLLANTGGDYSSALTFVEIALKTEPDDVSILDTLAHVYFLGGKIDEAIRTQERVVSLAPEAVIFRRVLERFRQAKEEGTYNPKEEF